jgi:hypothetical protein
MLSLMNRLSAFAVMSVVAACTFGLSGCSGSSSARGPVSRVDGARTAETVALSEQLHRVASDAYPKILNVLGNSGRRTPRSFEIVLTNEVGGNVGQAVGRRIYINAHYFTTPSQPNAIFKNPTDVDAVLVHEMVHVAQRYSGSAVSHWTEGIADYVCAKLGYTNAANCPTCSAMYPHYRAGYQCAAAFLLFLETQYAPDVVPELHRRLQRGSFEKAFFREICGKDLAELWTEFQQTSAYPPSARETLELQDALGYRDGNPPPDIIRRTETHFKFPAGSVTNALAALIALKGHGTLPGFASADRASATLTSTSFTGQSPGMYPFVLTWYLRKTGEPSWYAYTLAQASDREPWRLQQAQRISSDHRVTEDLPVPNGAP